jgi:CubicO group peptidase (beta-lactamase class C family)
MTMEADKTRRPHVRHAAFMLMMSALAVLALARPAFAPQRTPYPRATSAAAVTQALNARLGGALSSLSTPGVAVAVLREGQLIEWQSGRARARDGAPITATTQFEAASLSKPVTAYAVQRLAREGRVDLDEPLTRNGRTFTLRQVLSHSAGFDNDLTTVAPGSPPGPFAYAGAGYLFLGEVIEQATGQTFADHMNTVVLPELGMSHSQFGAREGADLAWPSIDAGLPFAVMIVLATLLGVPLLLAHVLACRLFSWRDEAAWSAARVAIFITALVLGLLGLRFAFGAQNSLVLAASSLAILAPAVAAWLLATRPDARAYAAICAVLFALLLVIRPAAPLMEREPRFLPAAGLRTTATDYARFMAHVLRGAHAEPLLADMLSPQVEASADHDWGLGFGLQRGATQIVWHWGVNFPGYQALAIANPENGDVAVVLLNGGAMSFSPDGMRYGGLEAAREAIATIQGGRHSAYWQDVQ